MSDLTLYLIELSPPARAVMTLAEILGLKLETKLIDFANFEHKSPEFLKINPVGTVPVLKDGDFYLSDSHAMLKYLLSKYGGKQSERLYPSDIRTRALIDQAMFFDTGVYFVLTKRVALPTLFEGVKGIPDKIIKDIDSGYTVLETFLKDGPYLAGEQFTIADISLGLTTAGLQAMHVFDKAKYPRIAAWYDRLRQLAPFKKHSDITTKLLRETLQEYWSKPSA